MDRLNSYWMRHVCHYLVTINLIIYSDYTHTHEHYNYYNL